MPLSAVAVRTAARSPNLRTASAMCRGASDGILVPTSSRAFRSPPMATASVLPARLGATMVSTS